MFENTRKEKGTALPPVNKAICNDDPETIKQSFTDHLVYSLAKDEYSATDRGRL